MQEWHSLIVSLPHICGCFYISWGIIILGSFRDGEEVVNFSQVAYKVLTIVLWHIPVTTKYIQLVLTCSLFISVNYVKYLYGLVNIQYGVFLDL